MRFRGAKTRLATAFGRNPRLFNYASGHVLAASKGHHQRGISTWLKQHRLGKRCGATTRKRLISGYHVFLRQRRLTGRKRKWSRCTDEEKEEFNQKAAKLANAMVMRDRARELLARLNPADARSSTPFGLGDEDYPLSVASIADYVSPHRLSKLNDRCRKLFQLLRC